MSVLLPSSTDPQVMKRRALAVCAEDFE